MNTKSENKLDSLTVVELRNLAREYEIRIPAGSNKRSIVELLSEYNFSEEYSDEYDFPDIDISRFKFPDIDIPDFELKSNDTSPALPNDVINVIFGNIGLMDKSRSFINKRFTNLLTLDEKEFIKNYNNKNWNKCLFYGCK